MKGVLLELKSSKAVVLALFLFSTCVQISAVFFLPFFFQSIEADSKLTFSQVIFSVILPIAVLLVALYLIIKKSEHKKHEIVVRLLILLIAAAAVSFAYSVLCEHITGVFLQNTGISILKIRIFSDIFTSLGQVPLTVLWLCFICNVLIKNRIFKGLGLKRYAFALILFISLWGVNLIFKVIDASIPALIIQCTINTILMTAALALTLIQYKIQGERK